MGEHLGLFMTCGGVIFSLSSHSADVAHDGIPDWFGLERILKLIEFHPTATG